MHAGAEQELLASQLWTKIGIRTGGEWNMDPDRCSWVTHGNATAASAKQSVEVRPLNHAQKCEIKVKPRTMNV
jgi:hypothetical protein